MTFIPSQYSGYSGHLGAAAGDPEAETETVEEPEPTPADIVAAKASKAKSDLYSSLAQSVGLLGSGIITTVGASNLQKSQQKHTAAMLKQQGKLAVLQGSASAAQASANRAAAALAGQGTKKIIYIVGGLLMVVTLITGTIVFLKQPQDKEEEE